MGEKKSFSYSQFGMPIIIYLFFFSQKWYRSGFMRASPGVSVLGKVVGEYTRAEDTPARRLPSAATVLARGGSPYTLLAALIFFFANSSRRWEMRSTTECAIRRPLARVCRV